MKAGRDGRGEQGTACFFAVSTEHVCLNYTGSIGSHAETEHESDDSSPQSQCSRAARSAPNKDGQRLLSETASIPRSCFFERVFFRSKDDIIENCPVWLQGISKSSECESGSPHPSTFSSHPAQKLCVEACVPESASACSTQTHTPHLEKLLPCSPRRRVDGTCRDRRCQVLPHARPPSPPPKPPVARGDASPRFPPGPEQRPF